MSVHIGKACSIVDEELVSAGFKIPRNRKELIYVDTDSEGKICLRDSYPQERSITLLTGDEDEIRAEVRAWIELFGREKKDG